jgi:hypothetical protein
MDRETESSERSEPTDQRIHREHLEQFIEELDRDHLKWYERQQSWHYVLWIFLEVVSVAAPLLTTIFAGIASALDKFNEPWVKCVLTSLPALAVASSSMLARLGVREMENSRELGRQEFELLLRNAKVDLKCAANTEELIALHRRLIAETARIDAQQHDAHHRITEASRRKAEKHSDVKYS